ncbi:hypothetical protein PF005_g1503 [Phytophthora fragariae]|uniref:Secreted protein n=1 Tax=Phytophthora fragariae TaxID=53985 RepID=A0A6A4AFX7_9STRA|nr:hypothetical protein PF009_g1439 [Phytophthora fragariae]KAE9029984.1 hypothetical protein PF011_g821 [Phytophthora fragariae]KAE9138677.1 hypothetical protein PF007_g1294 [Phytophthora fragariae]KAE9235331.1 hypothetical protein PF005_g1503 [Phytophthora fragariae]KAE9249387.1 hypothetical protein PF004_g3421 [Phytophthora fragariae]
MIFWTAFMTLIVTRPSSIWAVSLTAPSTTPYCCTSALLRPPTLTRVSHESAVVPDLIILPNGDPSSLRVLRSTRLAELAATRCGSFDCEIMLVVP